MGENQNWYRQLLALLLLSTAKAAVEYLTNPGSRTEAAGQLREAMQNIDYDSAAKALIRAIDDAALVSKEKVDTAIDTLRDSAVDAVDEAKHRAEKQAGKSGGGGRLRFIIGLAIGAAIAYFTLNQQRRDELLDRLTGASGPIQSIRPAVNQATQAVNQTVDEAQTQANEATDTAQSSVTQQAEQVAQDAAQKTQENQS
ncbi:MAG TPA: hypothetical protein VFB58_07420 [Chloroflexota bacterium]|nr:hypothetical protein [Chloroflexota bacterium]